MGRTGVRVGDVYEFVDDRGPCRIIQVTDVSDGQATCVVLKWRGKPKMRGMKVMLPDDYRYKLVV